MLTIEQLRDGWREGVHTADELVWGLTDLAESGNIDEIIEALSSPERHLVVDHWRDLASQDLTDFELVESVCAPDIEEYLRSMELRRVRFLEVSMPAIRRWVSLHPLPAGPDFPVALLEAALARLSTQIDSNSPLRQKDGRPSWDSPEKRDALKRALILSRVVERALEHARRGVEGDQRQAIAWETLGRFSNELLLLDGWQAHERELILSSAEGLLST